MFDKNGKLLGAKIAADGQWRFPATDSVPDKFARAIIAFEDKRFYSHWGVDVQALGRALWQNTTSGHRVSGGSTLTMQVMRLSRQNPPRTLWEKCKEIVLATRLEWSYNKTQILAMYASHAPFGGNVVGLDAAAWKYFGRNAHQLSWAESAMLAVLPNTPSLIHISKNRDALRNKRNRLLDKLQALGDIDSLTCELSKLEPLPNEPKPLPMLAYHLLERVHREDVLSKKLPNGIVKSTIDADIQEQVNDVLTRHAEQLRGNEIHNAAILVIDVETNDILAYAGNLPQPNPHEDTKHSYAVDIIPAPRSSGSILKPFLYAAMLHDGEMLPDMLFPDVPTYFKGYTPKNFDETYSGAVPAHEVIERSLNVPSIYMLNQYGTTRFLHKLRQLGMTTLKNSAEHYGLTLILGGAECTLWDLAGMYAGMTRSLKHFAAYDGKYHRSNYRSINYLQNKSMPRVSNLDKYNLEPTAPLRAGAVWHTLNAMQEVARPGEENYWRSFLTSSRVAWKTGTSFGFRDAWAVGCTPRYVVAVWAGNADGEGRPGLIGVKAAAPILFDVFSALGSSREWFAAPYDDMQRVTVCRASGFHASPYCLEVDSVYVPATTQQPHVCTYHKEILLSHDGKYRVHSDCELPLNMRRDTFFVLPPAQEWFYRRKHILDKPLPPYRPDCKATLPNSRNSMAFLYPTQNDLKIYVPTELDESKSRTVFEVAHANAHTVLYWHLDDVFVGTTKELHQLGLNPEMGKHEITVVDEDGTSIKRTFEILAKEK